MSIKQEGVLVVRDEKNRIKAVIDREGMNYAIYKADTAGFDELDQIFGPDKAPFNQPTK